MDEPYMILEENLTARFDNPASIESHSNHPMEKKSHMHRDDSYQDMPRKYDMYNSWRYPERRFIKIVQILSFKNQESDFLISSERYLRRINQNTVASTRATTTTLIITFIWKIPLKD